MPRRMSIRFSVGGCVLNSPTAARPAAYIGLIMYMGAVTRLAVRTGCALLAIFSRAEASPSGYRV